MNYKEKIQKLEKENSRGIHKYHMDSNRSFAIAYGLLAIAEALSRKPMGEQLLEELFDGVDELE
jgi:hypothetical protein